MSRNVALNIGINLQKDRTNRVGRSGDVVVDVYQVCFLELAGREVWSIGVMVDMLRVECKHHCPSDIIHHIT